MEVSVRDKQYWRDFYASGKAPDFPSQFAVLVQSWMRNKRLNIVEFGCGNGRDAFFFHSLGHTVTVTDQLIGAEMQKLAEKSERFNVLQGDIAETSRTVWSQVEQTNTEPAVVYSRFFQHAITDDSERAMLANMSECMLPNGMAFFEFRLDKDEFRPKEINNHYRRFQSADQFRIKLHESSFDCRYFVEGIGYAYYGKEDPWVGRFVAAKK